MRARKTPSSCGDVHLDVLLFGDEDSAEFGESAHHIDSCTLCQDRLSKMAAGDGDWDEVRSVLRPDEMDGQCGAKNSGSSVDPTSGEFGYIFSRRRIKLDFLSPPSHPEMLGRLGRYEIEQAIGAGGMGVVLKGFDSELNRPVAIKVLAPHLAHSGAARQRFAREARAAAAVVHEHVVAIHNVESEQEVPFIVMQYVPGRSLQARVEHEGPLEAAEILRIGMQAAAGLAAAHAQGVVHRDVKPANILLENGVERALLTDFGLARAADDASLTHSGIVAGTPHYMSPEQACGELADARSDLFGLGAVLYFMATGYPPFRAERAMAVLHRICNDRHRPVWQVNSNLPDELGDLIDRLLEKKPSRRFATATEVQQALARMLSRLQQPRPWRARRWLRRLRGRRWQVFSAAGVVLALGGLGWSSGWFRPMRPTAGEAANASSTMATPPSAEVLAAELGTRQAEFVKELAAVGRSVDKIASSPYPESLALWSTGDPWLKELQAAEAEFTRLEKSWSADSKDSSSLSSVEGEKP